MRAPGGIVIFEEPPNLIGAKVSGLALPSGFAMATEAAPITSGAEAYSFERCTRRRGPPILISNRWRTVWFLTMIVCAGVPCNGTPHVATQWSSAANADRATQTHNDAKKQKPGRGMFIGPLPRPASHRP